jgi:hypothetical protein
MRESEFACEPLADGPHLGASEFGERDVGASIVADARTPDGLAMPDQD